MLKEVRFVLEEDMKETNIPKDVTHIVFKGNHFPLWLYLSRVNTKLPYLISIEGDVLFTFDLSVFKECENLQIINVPKAMISDGAEWLSSFKQLKHLNCAWVSCSGSLSTSIEAFICLSKDAFRIFDKGVLKVFTKSYDNLKIVRFDNVTSIPSSFKFPPNIEYLSLKSLDDYALEDSIDVSYLKNLKYLRTETRKFGSM